MAPLNNLTGRPPAAVSRLTSFLNEEITKLVRGIGIMTAVALSLIELDDNGVARISGTKTKVIEVAPEKVAHGWSPEEIHFQHDYLSLAQIHAALAYHYEYLDDFDAEMASESKRAKPGPRPQKIPWGDNACAPKSCNYPVRCPSND